MTSSDRFPVPVRSAVKSNLTDWCFQKLIGASKNWLVLPWASCYNINITGFKGFHKSGLLQNPVNFNRFWLTCKLLNNITELTNTCFWLVAGFLQMLPNCGRCGFVHVVESVDTHGSPRWPHLIYRPRPLRQQADSLALGVRSSLLENPPAGQILMLAVYYNRVQLQFFSSVEDQ